MARGSQKVAFSLGEIDPTRLYSLTEVHEKTGLGKHSLRAARRAGLTVRYFGRLGFIRGNELIDHLVEHAKTTPPGVPFSG